VSSAGRHLLKLSQGPPSYAGSPRLIQRGEVSFSGWRIFRFSHPVPVAIFSQRGRQGAAAGRIRFSVTASLEMPEGEERMEFVDKILKCVDCGNDFVFTAGEQLFFFDKQFKNDPKRCKQCKARRASGSSSPRPETRTVCSECGTETTVPFKPTQGRPVLCRSCFQQKRTMSQAS
jgi:CxxC-x17-CxxC domain-containing protein